MKRIRRCEFDETDQAHQADELDLHDEPLRRARFANADAASSPACAASWPSRRARSSRRPIISNFKEGLTVLEYFNSTHGARKGLADTALKTANSGYLTRRLVDVAQDCIVNEVDCGTDKGLTMQADRRCRPGRGLARHAHPRPHRGRGHRASRDRRGAGVNGRTLITEADVEIIEAAGVQSVQIRSALTCETQNGVCAKSATAATLHAARRSTWARPSASSRRSRSASRAPSSPCAPSTSAVRRRWSTSPSSKPRMKAR